MNLKKQTQIFTLVVKYLKNTTPKNKKYIVLKFSLIKSILLFYKNFSDYATERDNHLKIKERVSGIEKYGDFFDKKDDENL